MKTLLKNAREQKGLKTREVAQLLGIDQALISKFESGGRKPTREQVQKLAALLEIDPETILVAWLKEKILYEIGQDEYALKALRLAEEAIRYQSETAQKKLPSSIQKILDTIDALKTKSDALSASHRSQIGQALELEYTFESNRLEGNTMTLQDTQMVVQQGLTIAGKSMREHLEVINHQEAIAFLKDQKQHNTSINEREILAIHQLIVRGIHPQEAGRYRKTPVTPSGNSHIAPDPFLPAKEMDAFFMWYDTHKNSLHPVLLAAETLQRLVAIHPFSDGNGRTSRLVMNLVLLRHGYVIATVKGDDTGKIQYEQVLEKALTSTDKEAFLLFIAEIQKESLARYFSGTVL